MLARGAGVAYFGYVRLKILDKYLLREFLLPVIYSFDAFLLLFVVYDLLEKLGEFLRHHARIGLILKYYLVSLPGPVVLILPIALLLGVLFSLSMLGKHNELLAMRVSGISVVRLGLPLFVAGALASAVAFYINEKFVPQSRERTEALVRELRGLKGREARNNFFFSNSQEHRDWFASRFYPETGEMENPSFYVHGADGRSVLDVYARRAMWMGNVWRFEDARIVQPAEPDVFVAATNFTMITETPKRLMMESKSREEMTTTELRRFIRALRRSGRDSQTAPYLVEMHSRYAMPLTCLIVVWLSVPLAMRVNRRGPMMSIGVALCLVVAFFILTQLVSKMGMGARIPPVLAAWLPDAVFFVVGGVLLWRNQ